MTIISRIFVHHAGGTERDVFADTHSMSAGDVDRYHQQKWNDKSTLGKWGGYTFFIEKDGRWTQFRAVGEHQIAQKSYNDNSVSICLAGNFTVHPHTGQPVNMPTWHQEATLQKLIILLSTHNFANNGIAVLPDVFVNINFDTLLPHRSVNLTSCFGNALPDLYVKRLMLSHFSHQLSMLTKATLTLSLLIETLFGKQRRTAKALAGIGAYPRSCIESDNR